MASAFHALDTVVDKLLRLYGALPYHPLKSTIFDALEPYCATIGEKEHLVNRRGVIFKLDLEDLVQRRIYYMRIWDTWLTKFFERIVQPHWIFFDVGANIGYFSLLVSRKLNGEGKVYAFEPIPSNLNRLRHNVELNQAYQVTVCPFALSDCPGLSRISIPPASNSGVARLTSASDTVGNTVHVETLDNFAASLKLPNLHLIKVDVEGYEEKVLNGAIKSIERFRPLIIVEINPQGLLEAGSSVREISKLFSDMNYDLKKPTWKGLISFQEDDPIKGFINVIGFPK